MAETTKDIQQQKNFVAIAIPLAPEERNLLGATISNNFVKGTELRLGVIQNFKNLFMVGLFGEGVLIPVKFLIPNEKELAILDGIIANNKPVMYRLVRENENPVFIAAEPDRILSLKKEIETGNADKDIRTPSDNEIICCPEILAIFKDQVTKLKRNTDSYNI